MASDAADAALSLALAGAASDAGLLSLLVGRFAVTTHSVTFGPTGCSTARSDGAHGGGFGGVFGCFGSGPFGRAFALGVPRGEGVWVSSEELSAR